MDESIGQFVSVWMMVSGVAAHILVFTAGLIAIIDFVSKVTEWAQSRKDAR